MSSHAAEHLLTDFQLRHTSQRIQILQEFLTQSYALSHSDLEHKFEGQIDRATIYRCLKQFVDSGILHRIPDDQFQTKYAVCATCETKHHHHDHVHFNCTSCNETTCLDEAIIPNIALPGGFRAVEKILIVQGFCSKCEN